MVKEKEWLEVTHEINLLKDDIKDSSQKIIEKLDQQNKTPKIDIEYLEILNTLGKIGTISGRVKDIGSFTESWASAFSLVLNEPGQLSSELGNMLIKHLLNKVCMISIHVEKKGNSYEIKIPDLNLMKFGL